MKKRLTESARSLRKNSTEAEKHLWFILRQKNLGVKFRRQAVIGFYIVDFVSFEKRLIIELDGGQHIENKADQKRDEWLSAEGFQVLRFWNNDVLSNLDGVAEVIIKYINTPTLTLPTRGRENVRIQE